MLLLLNTNTFIHLFVIYRLFLLPAQNDITFSNNLLVGENMDRHTLEKLLEKAKIGSLAAREELISYHRSFIAKVSSKTCKRYLTWENDEELSIALLAFNEAIDCYDRGNGTNFYTFARMIINRKLVDFFRKESKHKNISLTPLNQEEELSNIDKKSSLEVYKASQQAESFAEVVNTFNETLTQYRITLTDLAIVSPKHKDTKESLIQATQKLVENKKLMEHLYRHKKLPLKEMQQISGLSRRVLENGRKYIIALALIITCPQFKPLKDFTQLTIN